MQHAFSISKKTMKQTTSTDMLRKLIIVQSLKEDCKVIKGIGDLRSIIMINFALLLGFLPLNYYVYIPMHLTGDPSKFLKNEMSWDLVVSSIPGEKISEKLCEWTNRELKKCRNFLCLNYFQTCMKMDYTSYLKAY